MIPANEVAERAERIRAALEADGGFAIEGPIEHGTEPILAVHDPGLVRFLEEAWPAARAQSIGRPYLVADTYPERPHVRGDERRSSSPRGPRPATPAVGPAGGASTRRIRSCAGTYVASRAAVDVALTTVDLVLGGERAAYGLCRPPGHHAARAMAGGYCFFNNAAIAAEAIVKATGRAGRDPRRRLPPRQRHPADLLAPGRRAATSRSTPTPIASTRSSSATPTRRARGRGAARTSTCRCRRGSTTTAYLAALDRGARGDRGDARRRRRRLARLRHVRQRPDRRLRADDRRLPRVRPAGRGARPAARDPPGGRLPPADARRERPRLAARRRGPRVRAAAGGGLRRGRLGPLRDRDRDRVARTIAQMTSPTELPPHVRRLVDEIESEIGETDVAADEIAGATGRTRRRRDDDGPGRGGGPRDPHSRSARTRTARACSGRRSASTGCTPS